MEASVPGCRPPRVSRFASSASRASSSAAAGSPLALSSPPRLSMESSVSGCRSPWVSRHIAPAPHAQQRIGGSEVALILQQRAEVIDGGERVRMPIAKSSTPRGTAVRPRRVCPGIAAPKRACSRQVQGEASVTWPHRHARPGAVRSAARGSARIAVLVLALATAVGCVLLVEFIILDSAC
jgi:hypothetical protein